MAGVRKRSSSDAVPDDDCTVSRAGSEAGQLERVTTQALRQSWLIIKDTGYGFIADEALSRGAAIAFYTATSLAPVLLIVIAIAGLVFGHDAA
jgi:uncharacterized BrkB/YihY/UPF0761 family membrane protein